MEQKPLIERTVSGLHDALIQSLPPFSPKTTVLDIGCGTGAWLERLAALEYQHLYGIDRDIQQFKSQSATGYQVNLDYDDFPFEKPLDLITAIEIIEHLENPGRVFRFVEQNLAQDGYFLMTTPNVHSLSCRLKFLLTENLASFDDKGDKTHIYPVFLKSLERILPRYSLKIVKQWGYPEKGSKVYRQSTQLLTKLLGTFLPNSRPSDILCLLICKNEE